VWLDVPFVKQDKDGCGAAVIAMVMQYWLKQDGRSLNESSDVTEIKRALYVPGARGIYASGMESYFQQHGFRTFSFSGEWTDLQQHLQKGRPLIVALQPPGPGDPLHYVVVAGLDFEKRLVLLNDPAQRKLLKQNWSRFEKQWGATGKWTLLALPQPADRG
jgi:ABC-type bacteriocin/lantibiotic exporter with double-glycine peptidase domain